MLWDTNEVDCIELGRSSQFIHAPVHIKRLNMGFTFTAVYGLHSLEDRRSLWSDLTNLQSMQQGPRLIMGCLNAIRSGEDRPIGNPVEEMETRDFNEFIEDSDLTKIKASERSFTWANEHIYSTIDRALINAEWMLSIPHLEVWVMDTYCSNHSKGV